VKVLDRIEIDVNVLLTAMLENGFGHGDADAFGGERLIGVKKVLQRFDFFLK
jgi:hypothetical protein